MDRLKRVREVALKIVDAVRTSYWFLPSLMALAAIVLGAWAVWLDAGPGTDWLSGISWYQSVKPDGAQEVLSTIAGSMITVAGVVFSITIVAIAFAANQYGPRILTNFMGDRGNQLTLGTFIATFVYCLVVLRTIRGGDSEFIPQFAVLLGLAMALCSIAVLIYFIHHVPQSIHISNVVARIGEQLVEEIERRFPAPSDQVEDAPAAPDRAGPAPVEVRAAATGYIQAIDEESLVRGAHRHDHFIRLHQRVGTFVHCGVELAEVHGDDRAEAAVAEAIRDAHRVGRKRTPFHDVDFLVDELVEITARALSSGVNDPYTAITCLDWYGAAVACAAARSSPRPYLCDSAGEVRVIMPARDLETLVARGFGRMRLYLARDVIAATHALRLMAALARRCDRSEAAAVVTGEAAELLRLAKETLPASAYKMLLQAAAGFVDEDPPGA